jgi:putative oxidoreductase
MNQHPQMASGATLRATDQIRAFNWERAGVLYARIAVGSAFLSAVSGRFGLWNGTIDLKHFSSFLEYAREVLAFLPTAIVPYLAWAATVCETSLGILLILGLWPRWVALASAGLLAMFGTSMAISQGLKSPMDYSVYSASSAAILLALHAFREHREALQSVMRRGIL